MRLLGTNLLTTSPSHHFFLRVNHPYYVNIFGVMTRNGFFTFTDPDSDPDPNSSPNPVLGSWDGNLTFTPYSVKSSK